jgi:hypothetical protein
MYPYINMVATLGGLYYGSFSPFFIIEYEKYPVSLSNPCNFEHTQFVKSHPNLLRNS